MRGEPVLTLEAAQSWLAEVMSGTDRLRIESVDGGTVVCTAGPHGPETDPSGRSSSPALFWAIDLAGFAAVNVLIGPTQAMALAHSSISFLEPAEPGVLRVAAEVVKLASRSAVVDARSYDHRERLVSMSTLHFALPSRATRVAAMAGGNGTAAG